MVNYGLEGYVRDMKLSNIMLYWQENYQLGMSICVSVVLVVYITISVLTIRKARKIGYDICTLGFIPVIGIISLLVYKIKKKREAKRKQKEGSEIALW